MVPILPGHLPCIDFQHLTTHVAAESIRIILATADNSHGTLFIMDLDPSFLLTIPRIFSRSQAIL